MRARYPDHDGYVTRDGVKVFYEVYGNGPRTILLLPTWSIIHAQQWKMQIPYLARHFRVVTFDGRGNGRSDRPETPAAYAEEEFAQDALCVLDETGTNSAIVVGFSMGARRGLILAADHAERVEAAVFIGPSVPIAARTPERAAARERFWKELGSNEGWNKYNAHFWLTNYPDFLQFFFGQVFSEPHSTKPIEDCVGWGLETTGEILVAGEKAPEFTREQTLDLAGRVSCPVLVIHGDDDQIVPWDLGAALAESTPRGTRDARGLGTRAACTRPRQGEPAPPRLRRTSTSCSEVDAREDPRTTCLVHLVPDRAGSRPARCCGR
ncbi:MAG TPA: alpha/beta hydrolase [Actinomycetota bacterium]|nr:alpha/beta hydrolase [Actinomycetota bacterium]